MTPENVSIEITHNPIGGIDQWELDWEFDTFNSEAPEWRVVHDRLDAMSAKVTHPAQRNIPDEVPTLLAQAMGELATHQQPTPQYGRDATDGVWEVVYLVNNWFVTVWYWPEGYDG